MGEGTELAIVLVAKDLASETLKHVGEKFEGMGAAGKLAMAGIAAAGAAAVAGVGTLVAMADSAAHAADEVRKLARETGLSAEAASALHFAGEKLNIDNDALSKSFGIFSKNLENNSKAMADNHVTIVKSKDGHIDFEATLGKLADRFKAMPDGVEKTGIAMEVFGKSGKDMIPLLNRGRDGLKEMGDEAAKMGLVFSGEGLESARQYGLAQKELSERFEGLKNQVGMAVIPILTKVFGILSDAAAVVIPIIKGGLDILVGVFDKIVNAIRPAMTIVGSFFDLFKASTSGEMQSIDGLAGVWAEKFGSEMPSQLADLITNASDMTGKISTGFMAAGEVVDVFTGKNAGAGEQMRSLIGDAAVPLMSAVAQLRDSWTELSNKIKGAIDGIINYVKPFVDTALLTLSRFWTEIQPKVQAAFDAIGQKIKWVVDNVIVPVITFLSDFWKAHFDDIEHIVRDVFQEIVGVIKVAWDIISGIFRIALDLISGNWQGAWDDMVGMLRAVWDDIGHIFDSLKDYAGRLLSIALDLGKSVVTGIVNGLEGLASGLWNAITSALSGIHIDLGPFHLSSSGFSIDPPSMPHIELPHFASGGTVPGPLGAPMLAVVHGGEFITPPGRAGGGGGSNITINVGSVDSPRRVDEISQAVYRAYRLAGGSK